MQPQLICLLYGDPLLPSTVDVTCVCSLPCDGGAEDHGDGEDVSGGEEGEEVPADGQQPPAHLEEDQGDEDTYLKMEHCTNNIAQGSIKGVPSPRAVGLG